MNDFLTDNNDEVLLANGDMAIGYSNQQHQRHLLVFEKGSIKANPTACVGAANFVEAEDTAGFLREIYTQFTGDGMKVDGLKIDEQGKLNIQADYK